MGQRFVRLVIAQTIRTLGKAAMDRAQRPCEVRAVLLIRPDHLGDVLFTTPALRLLRDSLPQAKISYLTGPWAAPVLKTNENADEILTCSFPWFDGCAYSPLRAYSLLFEEARRLRQRQFDAVVNLRFDFWWGAALAYLSASYWRVGYSVGPSSMFLHPSVRYFGGSHEVAQNVRLVETFLRSTGELSVAQNTSDDLALDYKVTSEDRAFARDYLRANGMASHARWLILHPGTRGAAKRWVAERFAAVGEAVAAKYGMRVAITGDKSEHALAESIARMIGAGAIVAAGQTTLGQLAALFSCAALAVGVDSGPMHLAAAVGCPSVHLYGPSDHVAFAPCGDQRVHAVVRSGLECSPCHRFDWPEREMPRHTCMTSISVDQVLRTVDIVIGNKLACYDGGEGLDA